MVVIDIPTNDRMVYQKGLFVAFTNCVSLKGRIFCELNQNLNFIQLSINPEIKDNIRKEIYEKYRDYDINHLMDPYLIFKE